ncbi:hypothetical protein WICPIJ_002322 [Wickerhamomyces pijperi]|uniref:Uncharacterized protein n=1 Tax=Wickerhamomyces pijperi TaxID=599730 RepID=A0A9P8Q9C0_WICPI|nr:hypothetical protein WICPIJ_002322 [Wickerhamomyces pijperi]
MARNEWFQGIEDTQGINHRIKAIEDELTLLHQVLPQPNNSNNINERVHDLSSSLKQAILNEDTATIDALILSYGELPNLVDAKLLINEKRDLSLREMERTNLQNIESELINSTDSYDLKQLQLIKEKIQNLKSDAHKERLVQLFNSKVSSFHLVFMDLFKSSLKAHSWVNSSILAPSTQQHFKDLINLQSLLFGSDTETLWAFDIIAENFQISFDYHFNGDKDTNRIDKPELFYTYHLNYLESHLLKLNRLFDLSETEMSVCGCLAYNEFIRSSMIPVKYKLLSFLNNLRFNLSKEPDNEQDVNLLIHLIYETVKYDTALISQYYYDPNYDGEWTGMVSEFQYDDFQHVLQWEIRLNMKIFNQILNSADCFQIDHTSTLNNELKPTVSALKLKYLFEKLNKSFTRFFHGNYLQNKSLQKFKLKFFSKVYLHILQLYYTRLDEGLSAFQELFKKSSKNHLLAPSASSSTPGNLDGIDISGIRGLERLFRIYNSLKYISNSLNYWNQEFIFIELNELFNQLSEVKSLSLFDTILLDYNSLIKKTTKTIIEFQAQLLKAHLHKYSNKSWFLHPDNEDVESLAISKELHSTVKSLQDQNIFQAGILSNYEHIQFQNNQSLTVIQYFHQTIIKSNQFNHAGLIQLSFDFQQIINDNFPESVKLSKQYRHIAEILLIFNKYQQVDVFNDSGYFDVNQYAKLGDYHQLREALGLRLLSNGDILDTLLRIKE